MRGRCCLRGGLPLRADHRLRTDKKPSAHNRRSCIKPKTVLAVNSNRVFRTDALYPCEKHGSRAPRARPPQHETPLTPLHITGPAPFIAAALRFARTASRPRGSPIAHG